MNASARLLRTGVLVMLLGSVPTSADASLNNSTPRVTAVNGRIELGQMITVAVDHLSDWSYSHDPRKLVPYLDGRALGGIYPDEVNVSGNRLIFHLQQTPQSKKQWQHLLHEPVMHRPISFSVGLEGQSPFDTVLDQDNAVTLIVIPKAWAIVSLAFVLGLFVLLFYLATRTNILRDPGPSPSPGNYKPYDIGRVQTAFWFFIVTTSYVCIWLITGDVDTLSTSVLELMGISAFTALGPKLIGTGWSDNDQPFAPLESSTREPAYKGFFADILSDSHGCSLPRLQMLLWMALFGVVFVSSVYDNLAMPKFSGSLLALIGISAGTYVGFELLGKRSTSDTLPDRKGRPV